MTSPSYRAVVLAGRRAGGPDPLGLGDISHKAFMPIHGRMMIDYVLDALRQSASINQVAISAPSDLEDEFRHAAPEADVIPAGTSPARSIGLALEAYGEESAIIVTTCDHPLLTPAMLDQFVDRASASGCDVAVGCVKRCVFSEAFPETRRTFICFSDLAFSGANLFFLRPAAAAGLISYWRGLEELRKNPLAMARAIGVMTALKYLTRQLSHDAFTKTLYRRTGARCTMIPLDAPQAAIDVDKPADIALATQLLSA